MELQRLESTESLTRIALIGMLDLTGVGEVELKFVASTVAPGKNTIVDLSEVTFIGSLGMGMLLGSFKGLKRKGAKLVLLQPRSTVQLALETAKLTELLLIAESEDDALRLLSLPA